MNPVSHTLEPDASRDASPAAAAATPFPLKLLICFLAVDALERGSELVVWAIRRQQDAGLTVSPYQNYAPSDIFWVLVHGLLAVLLLLGTRWGRVLTQAILVIHLGLVTHELAVRNPELWVYLTDAGRFRLVATVLIDLAAILYLETAQARRALSR